jgi:glucose-1-phosphatase
MKLPVIMFDFGNVIGLFDFSLAFSRLSSPLGMSAVEFESLLQERGITALARSFEAGKLGPEEFAREVQKLAGLEMPFAEFEAHWVDIFTLNEPVARVIKALKKQGYKLLLGSNTNILHARFYRRKFREVLDLFDHFVFSYEVGELKPDATFFRACVDTVRIPAEDCVFIDDIEENVQGARALGLMGLHFSDAPTLIADLRRIGIEVPSDQR